MEKGNNMILIFMIYQRGEDPPLPGAMRILSWNCQGLRSLWTGRSLCKLVRDQAPTMCFLMETCLDKEGFDKLRVLINFIVTYSTRIK